MNNVTSFVEEIESSEIEEQIANFVDTSASEVHLHMIKAKYAYKLQFVIECKETFGKMYLPSEMEYLQKIIKKYKRKVREYDLKIVSSQLSKGIVASKIVDLNLNKDEFIDMIVVFEDMVKFETTPLTIDQIKQAYNLTEQTGALK